MDKTKALQNLLNGTASEEEIGLLKQALASGEISIGGDVNRSVVIIGSGNKVELTAEALGILKPETTSEEPVEGEPPYMGMRYFDTSDAALFFGREALTRELAARVANEPFLAIVGASGSGKSSVARAGLIPALGMGAVYVITPTAHPLESLAASLTRESKSVTATATLMDDLKNDSRSLRLYIRKLLSGSGGTNLLLLVDQFEETFTQCKDFTERRAFIENLLAAADEDEGRVRVALTLRADFYHHCAEYDGLRQALQAHQAYIGAMTPDELRQAITAPAEAAGWDFQPGLVDLILRDVGTEPGALPLLSHALLETWKRRQGRTLTLAGYADAGGVKKAIAQTAESVYDRLSPAEQGIARSIFLRLTELGEGVQDTRRRANLDELSQGTGTHDAVAKSAGARHARRRFARSHGKPVAVVLVFRRAVAVLDRPARASADAAGPSRPVRRHGAGRNRSRSLLDDRRRAAHVAVSPPAREHRREGFEVEGPAVGARVRLVAPESAHHDRRLRGRLQLRHAGADRAFRPLHSHWRARVELFCRRCDERLGRGDRQRLRCRRRWCSLARCCRSPPCSSTWRCTC